MDAAALLAELHARGLTLSHEESALCVSPRRLLTDGDREAIRRHKPEFLTLLNIPPIAPATSTQTLAEDVTGRLGRGPAFSLVDLPADLFETWQERVCVRFYDGRLPWPDSERLALADIRQQAELSKAGQDRRGDKIPF
jgi:hypothetical protein